MNINAYNIASAPMIGKTKYVSVKHTLQLYSVLSRLKTGEWVLVVMRNHPSPLDKAFVVTAEEAVMELLESEQEDLLALPEFADLRSVDITEIRKQMYAARGWETEKA